MNYTIISKKPIPFIYQEFKRINGQFFPVDEGILIHGGAGVVGGVDRDSGRPHGQHGIYCPEGVATVLDEKTYDRLKNIKKFQSDVKRGVMKVIKGAVTDQSRIDGETHNMLDNDLIPNRPFTRQDIEDAGGVLQKDGSVSITEAIEDIDEVRRQNAGKMAYMKKRDAAERKERRSRRGKRG